MQVRCPAHPMNGDNGVKDINEVEDYDTMVRKWLEYDPTVSDLVVSVIQTLPQRYEKMMEAVMAGDAVELEGLVHSLKGTSGNFHMESIYNIALELDLDLKARWTIDRDIRTRLVALNRIIEGIPPVYYETEVFEESLNSKSPGLLKVLLADDVFENRELIRYMLIGHPVQLDFAENGQEVLEKISEENYDVLLLDIQMPVLDGESVLLKLREGNLAQDMYIVVMTAHAWHDDMKRYMDMGADLCISKPVDKKVIREKMTELLNMKGIS